MQPHPAMDFFSTQWRRVCAFALVGLVVPLLGGQVFFAVDTWWAFVGKCISPFSAQSFTWMYAIDFAMFLVLAPLLYAADQRWWHHRVVPCVLALLVALALLADVLMIVHYFLPRPCVLDLTTSEWSVCGPPATAPGCTFPCQAPFLCLPVCPTADPLACAARDVQQLFAQSTSSSSLWTASPAWFFDQVTNRVLGSLLIVIEKRRGQSFGGLAKTRYAHCLVWVLATLLLGSDVTLPGLLWAMMRAELDGRYRKISALQARASYLYLVVAAVGMAAWMYAVCQWAAQFPGISIADQWAQSVGNPPGLRAALEMTFLFVATCILVLPQIMFQLHYAFECGSGDSSSASARCLRAAVALLMAVIWYGIGFDFVGYSLAMWLFFRDGYNVQDPPADAGEPDSLSLPLNDHEAHKRICVNI